TGGLGPLAHGDEPAHDHLFAALQLEQIPAVERTSLCEPRTSVLDGVSVQAHTGGEVVEVDQLVPPHGARAMARAPGGRPRQVVARDADGLPGGVPAVGLPGAERASAGEAQRFAAGERGPADDVGDRAELLA